MYPIPFVSRRTRGLVASGACLAALGACESAVAPATDLDAPAPARSATMPVRPAVPVLSAQAPTYPASVMYIVYREYVHRNPGISALDPEDRRFNHYMERRLRELYPNRGYAGMMRDAVAEARHNRQLWQQYERDLREYERTMAAFGGGTVSGLAMVAQCTGGWVDPSAGADPSWAGQDEHPIPPDEQLPTVQMEIDTLQLAGVEVDKIWYYESLATGTYAPGSGSGGVPPIHIEESGPGGTTDDLIRAAGEGRTPYSGEMSAQVNPVIIVSAALGMVGGYKYFRVLQAADRAVQRSGQYYPSQAEANTQRDAFRHIFLSMMLRRYVGDYFATVITDRHENENPNIPPGTVMDLHNNDIGRSHRYSSFRGHWLWDRWDHGEWGVKVRNFVNAASTNGAYIPEWAVAPPPTLAEAWAREACVPDERYIYFAQ